MNFSDYLSKIKKHTIYELDDTNNIIYLNYPDNLLSDFDLELYDLNKLKVLKANNNKLKRLDSKIQQLDELEILELSNNEINEINQLPKSLIKLILSKNSIEEFNFELKKIKSLDLSSNKITEFININSKFPNLSYLNLSNNNITDISFGENNNYKLKSLNLINNPINTIDLSKTPNLNEIFIGPISNFDFHPSFQNLKKISIIDLNGSIISKIPDWPNKKIKDFTIKNAKITLQSILDYSNVPRHTLKNIFSHFDGLNLLTDKPIENSELDLMRSINWYSKIRIN